MSSWTVYWILQLDAIHDTAMCFAILFGFAGLILSGVYISAKFENEKELCNLVKPYRNICIVFVIILIPLTTLLPTTRTACAIYLVPRIVESKVIQEDLPEIYNLAVERLKTELKEPQ